MVHTGTPLARLAELAGIATSYEDVFGERHDASEATVRELLTALRFDVSSDARTLEALRGFERRSLERGLEPVYVVSATDAVCIPLALPHDRRNAAVLSWTLTGEDASVLRGEVAAETLALRETQRAGDATYEIRALALGPAPAEGYYELHVSEGERRYRSTLIVAPRSCYLPELSERRGIWGLAAQVYSLRSGRDWGAGDFTDLRDLCGVVRNAGGGAIAVNPLHLLPRGASSPYGPSSRSFVNWAYLDITALPGHAPEDVPHEALAELRSRSLIDYPPLYETKAAAARTAFDRFVRTAASDGDDARAFAAFVREGGEPLRLAASFEVLAQRFRGAGTGDDWRTWPEPYQDPGSPEVAAVARDAAPDVAFHSYLQWQADVQLARIAAECHGMPVGLYRDLAVGTQLGGIDTWLARGILHHDVAVGAPPDLLNRAGQDWGVAPFDPLALREAAYAPFAALVRANARHAGALRIDHVMGLLRLWWVPAGFDASDGAFVTYRLDEMLGVLALESRRARCLVVGEDLGTVPPGFRERLAEARVLSYRVLQFEADDDAFFAPETYPELALVATGTHDLPTMAAYWSGSDIDVRVSAGTLPEDEAAQRERTERARKRTLLREAFSNAGVPLNEDRPIGLAANRFLAKTPGRILMVQLEDVLGETEQINLPTTTDEHPNWRRRTSVAIEELAENDRFVALADALRESRGVFPGSA